MSKKRKRDEAAIDTQLVDIYADLANADEDTRLKAAHSLLLKIAPTARLTSGQLDEILRRLIRGLCSGRKAARLGFSVALTEYLIELLSPIAKHSLSALTIPELIEVLKQQTHIGGNVSGQELRDHHLGRLFGAGVVIKSGILFHTNVDIQYLDQVLELILELAKRKSWLREECGWILYNAIQNIGKGGHDSKYAQLIIDKVHTSHLSKTPEGIAIWILTAVQFHDVKLPRGVWHHANPLHRNERVDLAQILKEASPNKFEKGHSHLKVPQKGTWTPKLHFAWDVVLSRVLGRQPFDVLPSKKSNDEDFATFWDQCVDQSLFADPSSEERKYWGFLVFQRALRDLPSSSFSVIFSKKLMRCLRNQLAVSGRYLHLIAAESIKAIIQRVRVDASSAVPALESLLSPPNGEINFDQISKTKTTEKITVLVKDMYLKDMVQVFRRLILQPGTMDKRTAELKRQSLADQVVNLVRLRTIGNEASMSSDALECFQDILSFFTILTYFNRLDDPEFELPANPPVSFESRNMFKSRISSCLTHLQSKSTNSAFFAYSIVSKIRSRELDAISKSVLEPSDTAGRTVGDAWGVLDEIHVKLGSLDCADELPLAAFKLLYSLTILKVYDLDADAVSMLDELKDCYEKLVKHREHGARKGSEVMVEIILSYVAKPPLLFRRMGQQVFSAFASDVNEAGLQSMIKILTTKEGISGQNEIFDQVDEADRDDEMSDVQEADITDASDTESPDKDDKSSSDDSDDENSSNTTTDENDSDVDEVELAAFNAKLAQALVTRPAGKEDAEEDDDSDEGMNDEQMEALDEHLVKIFRERKEVKSKKVQKKEAKETIINFKCRTLELLEIFIKQQHSNLLALNLLIPLLKTIRTSSKVVSSKACEVIRTYTHICKGPGLPKVQDKTVIFDLLEQVHHQATREGSNAYMGCCSQVSLLLVKILAAHDRENLRGVLAVYRQTQEKATFDPQCYVKTSFFSDWLNVWTGFRK